MKPVEARNTMIKLTRSPSASPPRPSPGSTHSPQSVERREHLTLKKLDNSHCFDASEYSWNIKWWGIHCYKEVAIEMSICGVKWRWSLNGFQHWVFLFGIHLDTVDGSHRDVGSVGSPCCFLVPAEEVLDLQGGGLNGGKKIACSFKNVLGLQVVCFQIL